MGQAKRAAQLTAVYVVAIVLGPSFFAHQAYPWRHDGLGWLLWLWPVQWIAGHLKTSHPIDLSSYGSWLSGALAPAAVFWAYRLFHQQAESVQEQSRSTFLDSIHEHYHSRFEDLSAAILDEIVFSNKFGDILEAIKKPVQAPDHVTKLSRFLLHVDSQTGITVEQRQEARQLLSQSLSVGKFLELANALCELLKACRAEVFISGRWYEVAKRLQKPGKSGPSGHAYVKAGASAAADAQDD